MTSTDYGVETISWFINFGSTENESTTSLITTSLVIKHFVVSNGRVFLLSSTLCHYELNIFGFLAVARTKSANSRPYLEN